MANTNIRNSKVDRRRLDDSEKQTYNAANAERALARTRAYRGNIAKQLNTPPRTVVPKSQQRAPEFRGHSDGKYIQAQRLREVGDARRRAESLRPEDPR